MAPLVSEYYVLLRWSLRTKPHLRKCLCCCRHCRIFFLTHPRNAGRRDLGCPFGCREAHRRKESTRRSIEFYRGEQGRILKGYQNEARRSGASVLIGQKTEAATKPQKAPCPVEVAAALPAANDPELVEHVRVVVSLIEDRPVSLEEIWEMLRRVLRQRSIGRARKIDQAVAWLNANPP